MKSHCLILISVCFGILMCHIPKFEIFSLVLLMFFPPECEMLIFF